MTLILQLLDPSDDTHIEQSLDITQTQADVQTEASVDITSLFPYTSITTIDQWNPDTTIATLKSILSTIVAQQAGTATGGSEEVTIPVSEMTQDQMDAIVDKTITTNDAGETCWTYMQQETTPADPLVSQASIELQTLLSFLEQGRNSLFSLSVQTVTASQN